VRIIFLIALLNCFAVAGDVLLPEATVAVVNGIAISEDELDKEVGKLMPKAYFHATLDEEKLQRLQEKATASLIDKTLLYHYALSQGLRVDDDEIVKVMESLQTAYGSKEQLDRAIKSLGFTPETFKTAVKKDEILKKLYKKEIEANVSDRELKVYYEKNRYKFKEPEKIRVRLIYVRNNPEDPDGREKAKRKIEEAYKKLQEGAEFADIAAAYSNAMSRIKGGDMGYLHKGRLDETVEEEAFGLKSGEMSKIIEKDIGYYIVKVEDKKVSNQLAFDVVKERLRKELKQRTEDERKTAMLAKLKATAVIIKQ